jgi:hypothetical protein
MADRIEEIIKEIAVKHGIAVGRDDPIMILQTINERLMQDTAAAQQEILEQFKSELESVAFRWGEDVVKDEIDGMTDQLAAPLREAKRVAFMNMVAAGMVVFAAGIALLASVL